MIMITTYIGAQNIQQSGFPGDIWRRWDVMMKIVEVVFMPSSFPVCRNLIYHKWLGDILLTWLAIYCKPWGHLYRKPQSQTACCFSLPDFFYSSIFFNILLTLWLIQNYIYISSYQVLGLLSEIIPVHGKTAVFFSSLKMKIEV